MPTQQQMPTWPAPYMQAPGRAELDRQRLAAVLARALAAWCQTHYAHDPALHLDFPAPAPIKAAA